jgi:rubrerythrin
MLGKANQTLDARCPNRDSGSSFASVQPGMARANRILDQSGRTKMTEAAIAAGLSAAANSEQDNWRWCNKCQGLAFAGNPSPGACPAGGTHDHAGSGNYRLIQDPPVLLPSSQNDWRWCNKCQGLAFAASPSPGACPAGGTHDHAGSGNYDLMQNVSVSIPLTQDNWRWCNKCQGLAFAGSSSPGACPVGETHDHAGSGNYLLIKP